MATSLPTSTLYPADLRTCPAQAGPADRFKIRENSVRGDTEDTEGEGYELRSCRCWSRACSHCAPVLGRRVTSRLLQQVSSWKHPRLLTLTVDRSLFTSPQHAYKYVTKARLLPRLMAALGVERWVRVLEFQMMTWDERGRGWPHWHFMIDKGTRRGYVNYAKAWHLWRDEWKVGGVDVTNQKKMEGKAPAYMVTYLCKYLVKFPQEGFPSWVMDLTNVRFIQGSRSVGALVCTSPGEKAEIAATEASVGATVEPEEEGSTGRLRVRSIRERIAGCGETSSLFAGSSHNEYVGRLPVRSSQVAIAASRGLLKGVKLETQSDGYGKQYMGVRIYQLRGETREEMEYRVQEAVSLLLHIEHINPPPRETGGGCDSLLAEWGCASVPEFLRRYREQVRKGRAFYTEYDAMEASGAFAPEPPPAYLWELIQEEDRRTMPEQ